MMGGDISNETPPRLVVLIEVVADSAIVEPKNLLKIGAKKREVTKLRKPELSKLWMIGDRFGLAIQLAAFSDDLWTDQDLSKLTTKLDNRGGNPFNYSELYETVEDLLDELPYLPNLKGVVDIRGRVARYGSWGIELDNL
jgi:hypothetical protein